MRKTAPSPALLFSSKNKYPSVSEAKFGQMPIAVPDKTSPIKKNALDMQLTPLGKSFK